MIEIKCIICGKKIKSPKIDQLCCDNKKCMDEFNTNQTELWKIKQGRKNE